MLKMKARTNAHPARAGVNMVVAGSLLSDIEAVLPRESVFVDELRKAFSLHALVPVAVGMHTKYVSLQCF